MAKLISHGDWTQIQVDDRPTLIVRVDEGRLLLAQSAEGGMRPFGNDIIGLTPEEWRAIDYFLKVHEDLNVRKDFNLHEDLNSGE